jgi:poly(A) polymerase
MTDELTPISVERIDPDAVKIVRRLHRFDHQAYLVGGCVRDLLLGRRPKDFDVSTSATPVEIRKLFRNCRIIGRRFRLAHIFFGPKIIETSTFRAPPDPQEQALGGRPAPAPDGADEARELLIRRDNTFGTAEQDAVRRDFTVNGLFYDLATEQVIDYVGGLPDVRRRCIRTIGDPRIRFQEDPVRILRAVKFAARLGFSIDPATEAAMVEFRGLLTRCSPARVLEEVYRLLGSGQAAGTLRLLHATGMLAVLFPELHSLFPPPEQAAARAAVPAMRSRSSAPVLTEELPRDAEPESLEGGNGAVAEPSLEEQAALEQLIARLLEGEAARAAAAGRLAEQLAALDRWLAEAAPEAEPPGHALLLANTLVPICAPLLHAGETSQPALEQVTALVQLVGGRLGVSRRDKERLLEILRVQHRLLNPGRRSRGSSLVRRDFFSDALRLLELSHRATGAHEEALARWTRIFDGEETGAPRRRRRRRRGRRGGADRPATGDGPAQT